MKNIASIKYLRQDGEDSHHADEHRDRFGREVNDLRDTEKEAHRYQSAPLGLNRIYSVMSSNEPSLNRTEQNS